MTRWFACLMSGVFVCSCLAGCLEEETPASATPTKTVAAKPPAAPAPPVASESASEPEVLFVYSAEGKRDPFVPLSQIRQPMASGDEEPATPLQSYDVGQFRLVGVIVGKGQPKAMVVAPDGKSYVLAKGVKIGKHNGVVVDITSEVILIKEMYYDFSGNVIENIQEIAVPRREGV